MGPHGRDQELDYITKESLIELELWMKREGKLP